MKGPLCACSDKGNAGFLWVVPTNNTGIFLRGSKLPYAESKWSWYPKRKLGLTMHFSEIRKFQCGEKHHTLLRILLLFKIIVA